LDRGKPWPVGSGRREGIPQIRLREILLDQAGGHITFTAQAGVMLTAPGGVPI
jgi:hypothetical protein